MQHLANLSYVFFGMSLSLAISAFRNESVKERYSISAALFAGFLLTWMLS